MIHAGRKEILKNHVLSEWKLDETDIQLEACLKKMLCLSALQCGLEEITAHVDTKLLSYSFTKITSLYSLLPPYWEARTWYCRWFQDQYSTNFLTQNLVLFKRDMAHWSGYINSQNNRYWNTENTYALH
jgi:hypothetical protein